MNTKKPSLPADVNAPARENPTKKRRELARPAKKSSSERVEIAWDQIDKFVRTPQGIAFEHGFKYVSVPKPYPQDLAKDLRSIEKARAWKSVDPKRLGPLGKALLAMLRQSHATGEPSTGTMKKDWKGTIGSTSVALYGFGRHTKTLKRCADKAFASARKSWSWAPKAIDFVKMEEGPRMGAVQKNDTIIWISPQCFRYSDDSITRVILHELAHQYRFTLPKQSKNDHDKVFCAALSKVDAVVRKNPKGCAMFHDDLHSLRKPNARKNPAGRAKG